jgi:hypothetical protein
LEQISGGSVTTSSSLHEIHTKPSLHLTVDTGDFSEDGVQKAIAELQRDFQVDVTYIAQFSYLTLAHVAVEIIVTNLPTVSITVISTALYDVLKAHFLRPKKASSTRFTLEVRDTEWAASAIVETNNEVELRQCIDTLINSPLLRGASEEERESAIEKEDRERKKFIEDLQSIEKGQTPESLHNEITRRLGGQTPQVRVRRIPHHHVKPTRSPQ